MVVAATGRLALGPTEDSTYRRAIAMLKHQHREVEALFNQMHKARTGGARRNVFDRIVGSIDLR